eukprot:6204369-Pleurochrysis_carterae.AAC.6
MILIDEDHCNDLYILFAVVMNDLRFVCQTDAQPKSTHSIREILLPPLHQKFGFRKDRLLRSYSYPIHCFDAWHDRCHSQNDGNGACFMRDALMFRTKSKCKQCNERNKLSRQFKNWKSFCRACDQLVPIITQGNKEVVCKHTQGISLNNLGLYIYGKLL